MKKDSARVYTRFWSFWAFYERVQLIKGRVIHEVLISQLPVMAWFTRFVSHIYFRRDPICEVLISEKKPIYKCIYEVLISTPTRRRAAIYEVLIFNTTSSEGSIREVLISPQAERRDLIHEVCISFRRRATENRDQNLVNAAPLGMAGRGAKCDLLS